MFLYSLCRNVIDLSPAVVKGHIVGNPYEEETFEIF